MKNKLRIVCIIILAACILRPVQRTFNTRGRLLATSSVLPTAAIGTQTNYRLNWTFESNSGLTAGTDRVYLSLKRTANDQFGYWFVALVGTTEISEVLVEFGVAGGAERVPEGRLNFSTTINANSLTVRSLPDSSVILASLNDPMPANSTIKIYMAGID